MQDLPKLESKYTRCSQIGASCKVFGIGLGKTGTTSLHFALELLGYRSAHASTLFCETLNVEASSNLPLLSTLEEHYDAFVDWPMSYLYRQLDRRFQGSKFILTVRNSADRYQSALRHIREDKVRKSIGLSHGWVEIESEEKFLANDLHHTLAVRSYFRKRVQDLLVLNISEGHGWPELCPFLRRPVPAESFPHHKATGSHDSHFLRSRAVEPHIVSFNLPAWAVRA